MSETAKEPILRIQVAQNLPVSNTGSVPLGFIPVKPPGAPIIEVPVKHSALLKPGEYSVIPNYPAKLPPIAKIVYDPHLQHFNIEVLKTAYPNAQFSVLVNLTDVAGLGA